MMKKLIVLCTAFLAGSLMSHAVGSLGVMGSYWSNADGDGGFGVGGKLKFKTKKHFAIDLRGTYFPSLSVEKDQVEADLKVNALEAGVAFDWALAEKATFYLGGGAGAGFTWGTFDDPVHGANGDADLWIEPMFYGLAGLEYLFGEKAGLFLEGKYTWCGWGVKELGTDVEGRLDGLGGNAGLMVKW